MTRRISREEIEAADVIEEGDDDETSVHDSRVPPDSTLERLHKGSQAFADWLKNCHLDDEREVVENPVSEWDMFHGGRNHCSPDLPRNNGPVIY
ncbi:hypothetical protein A2318_00205 [Candidatus Uhrbacteria bacterium RIFOXYB2_FULL_45_11]|uniref:Uncharacterized protein n=1 Tax=Candidatus Uhrbacteria bacterium RIFOXYB2_FULL_45_11 TaxID=1802421 RepID=A0A1F7W915_9BACT|nr:MAG: hypothetical protein A2318_00205 [Candidatus Uhrbacteria bacterium RIFOXYB2_FULL_45_11]